jgi:hypothetical protein
MGREMGWDKNKSDPIKEKSLRSGRGIIKKGNKQIMD